MWHRVFAAETTSAGPCSAAIGERRPRLEEACEGREPAGGGVSPGVRLMATTPRAVTSVSLTRKGGKTMTSQRNLQLGMQELEEMDAPGFWTAFIGGGTLVTAVTAIGFAFT